MQSSLTIQRAATLSQPLIRPPVHQNKHLNRIFLAGFVLTLVAFTTSASELHLEGQFIQGGLVRGVTEPGSKVTVNGTSVRVSAAGLFLVGFGRDEATPMTLEIASPGGEVLTKMLTVASREYKTQRIDGLPPKKVTPDETVLQRIQSETALVKAARARDDERTDFLTGFIGPAKGPITGVYGSQRILNGEPRRPHFGVDVAGPVGTPVVAPADGVVTLAHPDLYFSGGTLVLDHGHGLSSAFLHLSRILVEEGRSVQRGEVIAEIGATGRVTGAHLDWRMSLFDRRIDPQLLVGPMTP